MRQEESQSIKIFVGWSKNGKDLAELLHSWLKKVLQNVDPWMSSEDGIKGSRWRNEVAAHLQEAQVGIFCITPETKDAPWIMFEAGALSMLEGRLVCPLLFGIGPDDIKGPLDQFNATLPVRDQMSKLVKDINDILGKGGLREDIRLNWFDFHWRSLEEDMNKLEESLKKRLDVTSTYMPEQRRPERLSKDYQREISDGAQSLKRSLLEMYGFKVDSSTATVEITDFNGTSKFRRSFQGVKTYSQNIINRLPGSIMIGNSGSEFIKYPQLNSVAFSRPVSMYYLETDSNGCHFQIEIAGGLKQDDPPLSYEYESNISNSFLMTKEDVEMAYTESQFKQEYFSAEANIPTDELIVEVIFPQGFNVDTHPGVFPSGLEVIHEAELKRIKDGFQPTERGARLRVKDPLLGFIYIIHWMPLSAKELSTIMQSNENGRTETVE